MTVYDLTAPIGKVGRRRFPPSTYAFSDVCHDQMMMMMIMMMMMMNTPHVSTSSKSHTVALGPGSLPFFAAVLHHMALHCITWITVSVWQY